MVFLKYRVSMGFLTIFPSTNFWDAGSCWRPVSHDHMQLFRSSSARPLLPSVSGLSAGSFRELWIKNWVPMDPHIAGDGFFTQPVFGKQFLPWLRTSGRGLSAQRSAHEISVPVDEQSAISAISGEMQIHQYHPKCLASSSPDKISTSTQVA